jgi:hypothetical protein
MVSVCEHGNETSGAIKIVNFFIIRVNVNVSTKILLTDIISTKIYALQLKLNVTLIDLLVGTKYNLRE